MKQLIIILFAALFIGNWLNAQVTNKDPFEKMNQAYELKMQQMEEQYAQRMERMQKEYNEKIKRMNSAFESYLKKAFKQVEQKEEVIKPIEVPKPVDQPIFIPVEKIDPTTTLTKIPEPVAPEIEVLDAPAHSISPIFSLPEESDNYKQKFVVDFFGSEAQLLIDKRSSSLSLNKINPKCFAQYWEDYTSTYYHVYIQSLIEYAQQKNLNDWGIYQIIHLSAQKLFTSTNNQTLWEWATLNQAGYLAKIGYINNELCLMLPFAQQVFEKPYYSISGINYYLMNNKLANKKIYTYEDNFGGAAKLIDLNLPYSLNFDNPQNIVSKTTLLPNEASPVTLKMNKTIIQFLASYPQTDNTVYLNAAMSASVKQELYDHIKPKLEGMNEIEAVSYLMKYLHHSFEYKTDRDQFTKEKMFFPDEIFYYPFSDCEDRTVLFTRLVNDLLNLDVVALTYFSHMAAAVSFSQPVDGYSFLVSGQNYTICDPTYIDAPVGAVMPEYEKYKPLAIKINNNNSLGNIWQRINKSLENGNKGKIFINQRQLAENGTYIASGWFTDRIVLGNQNYQTSNGTRDLWFATFNNQGKMEWFLPVQCSNYGYTQAFNVGKKGNVYALINYAGNISINQSKICQSETPAHLILGLSNQSYPVLKENLDFEVPEGKKLAFYGKYRADGSKIDLLSFPTDKVRFDSKITVDSNNEIVVRGIVGEIEGLTKEVPITMSTANYNSENTLEKYLKEVNDLQINKHMASLFAAIKTLSSNGGRISGLTVHNLINKNNPDFRKENPDIYKGLLSMQFVINNGGIIKVETYKEKDVSLFSMRIKNNSHLQIIESGENEFQLHFLNGVDVGKAIIWYKLNKLTLSSEGNMLFDYDDDHTQKMVNIDDIIN